MGGVRWAVLADHRAWLLERIREQPDLTLQALRTEPAGRGVIVRLWVVRKLFASEGITFKKGLLPTEQLRSAVARKRERWKRPQQALSTRSVWCSSAPCGQIASTRLAFWINR